MIGGSAALLVAGAAAQAAVIPATATSQPATAPTTAVTKDATTRADGHVDEKVQLVLSAQQTAMLSRLLGTSNPRVLAEIVSRSMAAHESGQQLSNGPPVFN